MPSKADRKKQDNFLLKEAKAMAALPRVLSPFAGNGLHFSSSYPSTFMFYTLAFSAAISIIPSTEAASEIIKAKKTPEQLKSTPILRTAAIDSSWNQINIIMKLYITNHYMLIIISYIKIHNA